MEKHMNTSQQKPVLNTTRTYPGQPRELTPPTVIGAIYDEDHEGLLPVSALTQPLKVEFTVWDTARTGDTYQLLWNSVLVSTVKTIAAEQEGDPIFLELPVQFLQMEGAHGLAYRTVNVRNGTHEDSPAVRVEIDLTPPGRPQLGPMKFPQEIEGGLTSAELTSLGDVLVAEIGSYTGMYQHDVIRTYWGAVEGPGAVVNNTDMGLNRVQITYTRAFLESLGDFNGDVTYTVTDRAGNLSAPSLNTHVQLALNDAPNDFPAPIIDPAVGALIDYAEARSGITVDIPRYPGVEALDQIILTWEGIASAPQLVPEGSETQPAVLSFTVPYLTIAAKAEGVAHVTYSVHKAGQLFGTSLESSIDVFVTLPGPSELDAPVIQGSSASNPNTDDNFIDEDDYELNSRAIIKWKTGFALSDELNLYWGGETILAWYQIKASDISAQRDLILPIANETMKAQGTGAQIPVFYTLTRLGNPNPKESLVQEVVVRSKDEMPGGVDGPNGPTFNTTPEGYVGPIENPNGAVVTIAPYLNIREGQTIEFTFKAFDETNNPLPAADFSGERTLDRNDVINGYAFTVPLDNLKRICFGFGEAYFKVVPAAGSNQSAATSRTTRVPIDMTIAGKRCNWLAAASE
jgi:hypothetical protein